MPLWSDGSDGTETKPKYILPANIGKHYNPNFCYATERGWEITNEAGLNELLVAIGGLSTRLGASDVVALEWGAGTFYGAGVQTVVVVFNEAVTVTGHPTLNVTGSVTGPIVATHVSNIKNRVTFSFTIPDGVAETLTIVAQDIALAGGTMKDADGTLSNVNVGISSPVAFGIYPVASHVITIASPVSATFSTGTYVQGNTNRKLTVVYDAPVTVVGVKTIATSWAGTIGVAPTATYASGSGTATLVFDIGAIPSEAGTLSIATQTIGGAGTIKNANATTVDYVISAGIATAAGSKIVAA